ncbi:hypothetical protein N7468_008451 [Penicillium chermesinum]|uniref:Uncharacterized protein n=1 Tax=Penicillium chermesinum TaxID=63820 RepID=A0A9W9TIN5_9EURO|nr:uncharacterized protein N7468_008451 [Penicillium chermesinum]KAJ5223909.1 hypothetical protein N7468_008451 [Penicillium chermesinum]
MSAPVAYLWGYIVEIYLKLNATKLNAYRLIGFSYRIFIDAGNDLEKALDLNECKSTSSAAAVMLNPGSSIQTKELFYSY